ncbi:MAG TPA: hypothetical protein VNY51_07120 [Candidatus Dormibacteraeota bacterium]|jgi:hypothetical protein|nr:hypothetical protein [Candidatus Dormibacteraeota bacterium]
MTRINLFRNASFRNTAETLDSVSCAKTHLAKSNFDTTGALIFAALLIACSFTMGCSSEQPKPISSANPTPIMQPTPPAVTTPAPAPVQQAAAKPARKKVVRKAPVTLTYADKPSGVSFQYPRKYALKTGDAANELVASGAVPMDFAQPGGMALAAVALPDTVYPNSDLASAFFNVSMNKNVTAEQCEEFSVPQPNPTAPADPAIQATAQVSTLSGSGQPMSKLMIGDLELQSTENKASGESGSGTREATSRYYHVFQSGACYEFALQVATNNPKAETSGETTAATTTKHIDREEIFKRLEKILATVKINPAVVPEVNIEVKSNAQPAPAQETPAQ